MLLASVLEGGSACPEPRGTPPPQSSRRCPDIGGGRPPHGMRRPSVRVTCESAGRVSRPARPGRSGGSSTHVGGARRCGRRGGCQAWGGRPAATPRSRRRSPCRWPRSRRGRPSRRRRPRSPHSRQNAAGSCPLSPNRAMTAPPQCSLFDCLCPMSDASFCLGCRLGHNLLPRRKLER